MTHVLDWLTILTCAAIVAMVLTGLRRGVGLTHGTGALGEQAERLAQDARAQEDEE